MIYSTSKILLLGLAFVSPMHHVRSTVESVLLVCMLLTDLLWLSANKSSYIKSHLSATVYYHEFEVHTKKYYYYKILCRPLKVLHTGLYIQEN